MTEAPEALTSRLYKTRPQYVQAICWHWMPEAVAEISRFGARVEPTGYWGRDDHHLRWALYLYTPAGRVVVCEGDYIIRHPDGSFSCADEIVFHQDYDPGLLPSVYERDYSFPPTGEHER